MPTLIERIGTQLSRSRVGGALFAEERRQTRAAFDVMLNAYEAGPWLLPPEQVLRQLQETDPWMVYNLLDQTAWEIIGGYAADTSAERARAVNESRRLYKYNPLAQWAIWLWTSWGMGDSIAVSVPDNPKADEAVQEFFEAERNEPVLSDDNIKELSRWLLIKGNRFLAFFTSTLDGTTTVRTINQDQMTPIKNPNDAKEIWFYKRAWTPAGSTSRTVYYPDWKTYFSNALDKRWATLQEVGTISKTAAKSWGGDDQIGDGADTPRTDTYILFISHNIKDEDDCWGWPLLTNPRAWMQAHQHLMESRLTLAEAASMFVRRKKVTGGSRAVKSVVGTIASNLTQSQWTDTNPPAVAGGVEVENAMVDTEDLPLRTGASDTGEDNRTFSWMALLGAGLFPTSAGLDTSRWATALEMDKAQSMLFEEYKSFWAAQFRKVATIVLLAYEKHTNVKFGEYTIHVGIDTFSLADFPVIAKTIGQFVRDTITPLIEVGALNSSAAIAIVGRLYKMSLDALGVEDADELVSDEALGVGAEEEPEEAPPEEESVEVMRHIIESASRRLRDGEVGAEVVAEWAVAELLHTLND